MESSASLQGDTHSRFELQTLLETSRLLAESHDLDFVLNNLLLITMGKLMVSRGLILMYQPASGAYVVSKSKGKASLPQGQTVRFSEPEKVQQQSVVSCGQSNLPIPELIKNDESCTLFNLRTRSNHIGFLCLGSKGNAASLKQHEIDFVESLSIISSVAIANSHMFTELKQTNRRLDRSVYELNTLLDLSKDFNQMVDREEIIRVFKFAMLGQMLIRTFFFVLEQDTGRSLVAESNIKSKLKTKAINHFFTLEHDVVLVDERMKNRFSFLRKNDIHALISLYFQKQKLAVVGIGAKANGEPFRKTDFNFLQSLGNLALLSIQKNLLLEERIEKERLEEELTIARAIQQGLLPHPIPTYPGLDIAAQNIPTRQVGGDYFDILQTPENNLLVAIGDVTGKGTPAALLMANLQAMLHVLLPVDISLKAATARINDMLYQNTPKNKFVTFFWGKFDPNTQNFTYVNAGHNAPLLFKKGKAAPEKLEEGGLILGAMPTSAGYNDETVKLASGDILVFYTDGINEAMNEAQTEEFGEQRFVNTIQKCRQQSSEQIIQVIIDEVNSFSSHVQSDDITLIVVKVES